MFHSTKFSILPPVVKNLLIINLLVFLATIVLRDSRIIDLNHILAWHGAGSAYPFQIWQPITYMFMHGDFYHIFFISFYFDGHVLDMIIFFIVSIFVVLGFFVLEEISFVFFGFFVMGDHLFKFPSGIECVHGPSILDF